MHKKLGVVVSGLSIMALALVGCTSNMDNPNPDITNSNNTPTPKSDEGLNERIDYTGKWVDKAPVELPFKAGEYSISYREESKLTGSAQYTADGDIGFYKDGTCAFDISGTKINPDGVATSYRIVKLADEYPLLRLEGSDFWINDMLQIEYDFRTNFPVMAAFPKYKNVSSWCALAMSMEIGTRGGAAKGYFLWDLDKGKEFAATSKEWYFDYILDTLSIDPKDYEEARDIIDLTYYGLDTVFTYDGQGKIATDDRGIITLSTGIQGESDLYVEIILEPSKKNLNIKIDPSGETTSVTHVQTITNSLTEDYKGIDYLRDIKKEIEDFAAANG
jgi:hypothetical protein